MIIKQKMNTFNFHDFLLRFCLFCSFSLITIRFGLEATPTQKWHQEWKWRLFLTYLCLFLILFSYTLILLGTIIVR